MRGTLLNTATVAAGALLGLAVGREIPEEYKSTALHGLGLVVVGIGIKMFFGTKNPLIAAASVALGGVLGLAMHLHGGVEWIAHFAQVRFGGQAGFAEGIITSFVLFCVGPMTLLGCLQDGLEGKTEILSLKSTMDGIASFFLAATAGLGLLVTALLVLIFQGTLTLMARPLQPLAQNEAALAETSAVGGALLLSTGLGLLQIADLHTTNYLPALVLAPCMVLVGQRVAVRRAARQDTGILVP